MKKLYLLLIIIINIISSAAPAYSATTYYEIWRNTTNNPNTATRIKQWYTATSYDDLNAEPGQHYYYWIRALACQTAYGDHYVATKDWQAHCEITCPIATTVNFRSPVKCYFSIFANGMPYSTFNGNANWYVYDYDSGLISNIIDEWVGYIDWGNQSSPLYERKWPEYSDMSRDIDIASYTDLGDAEVYFYTEYYTLEWPGYGVGTADNIINVTVQDSAQAGPISSASQGTYTDKVVVSWSAVTNICSEINITPSSQGWTKPVYPDMTGEGTVNLMDFAILAANWFRTDCGVSNGWCNQADIDHSTDVSYEDALLMAEHWLEEIDIATGIIWVYINDSGIGGGHEGFSGQMGKYETTNAQYCQFLNAAKASGDITVSDNYVYGSNGSNSGVDFVGQRYYDLAGTGYMLNGATNGGAARIHYTENIFIVDSGFENHPATHVNWYGATAFCNYYNYRLPTEWEWQAAADYDGSYTYGCGPGIDNNIANYYNSSHPYGTTAVGAFGIYGYGMADMAGNVWEWTSSIYNNEDNRILRGGSWDHVSKFSTVSYSTYLYRSATSPHIGFRVCR